MVLPGKSGRKQGPGLVAIPIVFFLFYATTLCASENATVELNPKRVIRGNNTTIRIRTAVPWNGVPVISEPDLESPLVWWAYPYARPWTVQDEDGRNIRMIEILGSVRVDAPGFHKIGPFVIRGGDKEVITAPTEIIGLDFDEGDFLYPIVAGWRSIPSNLWEGQSIPVILEARNLSSLVLSESVVLNSAATGLLEEEAGLGGIVTRSYGSDILYDVPMTSWIWTLDNSEVQNFPGARVSVNGLTRSSKGFSFEVNPLPDALDESGAVGSFQLDTRVNEGPFYVGDILSVWVRVEGKGNMSVLRPPEPVLSGAELVSRGSSSSYLPSLSGYEGWREERYDFRIGQEGQQSLTTPEWLWFETEGSGRVRRSVAKKQVFTVEISENINTGTASAMLGAAMYNYRSRQFHAKNIEWYLLSLPGLFVFALLLIFKHPRLRPGLAASVLIPFLIAASHINPKDVSMADDAKNAAMAGNWEQAESTLESLLIKYDALPGLLHDLSVVKMERGKPDESVTMMRKAIQLRPGSRRLEATLRSIESRLGLTDQIPIPLNWSPSLIFIVWIVAINGIFFALALLLFRRGGREMIMLMSTIIFGIASSIAVVYTAKRWEQPTAVVRVNSEPLRKIPGPLATAWLSLPAGSAVSITAIEGDDCLVLTGYGLEGWLPVSSLSFFIGDNENEL